MSEGRFNTHVSECSSWDALISLLDRSVAPNGNPEKLAGYGTFVDSHHIRDQVSLVKNGKANVRFITRNYGLRTKVVELLTLDSIKESGPDYRLRIRTNKQ